MFSYSFFLNGPITLFAVIIGSLLNALTIYVLSTNTLSRGVSTRKKFTSNITSIKQRKAKEKQTGQISGEHQLCRIASGTKAKGLEDRPSLREPKARSKELNNDVQTGQNPQSPERRDEGRTAAPTSSPEGTKNGTVAISIPACPNPMGRADSVRLKGGKQDDESGRESAMLVRAGTMNGTSSVYAPAAAASSSR